MSHPKRHIALILSLAVLLTMVLSACTADTDQPETTDPTTADTTEHVSGTDGTQTGETAEYTQPLLDGFNQVTFYWTYPGTGL